MFSPGSTVLAHVERGELRGLAPPDPPRTSAPPNLPTLAESGLPDFDTSLWFGVVAPVGTPRAIVDKLAGAVLETLHNAPVAQRTRGAGRTAPADRRQAGRSRQRSLAQRGRRQAAARGRSRHQDQGAQGVCSLY